MRSISIDALAKLATKKGTEPLCIISCDFAGNGTLSWYADRDIDSIPGRILSVSELDNTVNVSNSSNSQQVSVTLDDADGTIKAIMDSHDIHQRDVAVYQHFAGLPLADKILLFLGKIYSPITWSERDRTVSFTIVSQIEDREVGFSAEEGNLLVPRDLIGKPWPMIFGTPLDVPALQVNQAVSGTTLSGLGILSGRKLQEDVPLNGNNCGIMASLSVLNQQQLFLLRCADAWRSVSDAKTAAFELQARNISKQITNTVGTMGQQIGRGQQIRQDRLDEAEEKGLGQNPVRILGGEDFPQNVPIVLNVNGGLFTGIMRGDSFSISARRHPEKEAIAKSRFDSILTDQVPQDTFQPWDFREEVPAGKGDIGKGNFITSSGFVICTEAAKPTEQQVAQHFWADSGARVVLASDEPITYIVSIVPGTVLAVKAFKEFNGERRLVNVPNDLWHVQTQSYGPVTAVQLVVHKPLSTIIDQGWSDDIYVTFQSSIGPNTVNILEYLISNYTELTTDSVTFNAVRAKVDAFPMAFPLLERNNIIEVLKKIAFAARCAIWLSNGKFYLKYLPEEPTADDTITVSDIYNDNSVQVELTSTEGLVTKFVAEWRLSWASEKPERSILRHNVNKYGTKLKTDRDVESTFDFTFYNQPDIVQLAATFWLIRKANTWKIAKFSTPLTKLNLETFDTVLLDLPPYVASSAVKAIVQKASYNSDTNQIDFECWVPVKSGAMTPYKFVWPKSLSIDETFPPQEEIAAGNAGGLNSNASGLLPIGDFRVSINRGEVWAGGVNIVYGANSDWGVLSPTDVGFSAQTILPPAIYADLITQMNPNPLLRLNYIDQSAIPPGSGGGSGISEIDLATTRIVDSRTPQNGSALLSDFFMKIGQRGELFVDPLIRMSPDRSSSALDSVMEFAYDKDEPNAARRYAAKSAFLKEEDAS